MYTLSKMMRDHMLPHSGTWTLNETILASGQATADNLAAQMSMIMYAARCPDVAMLKKIYAVLDRNAEAAAAGWVRTQSAFGWRDTLRNAGKVVVMQGTAGSSPFFDMAELMLVPR